MGKKVELFWPNTGAYAVYSSVMYESIVPNDRYTLRGLCGIYLTNIVLQKEG